MKKYCSIDWLSVTTPHGRGALYPKPLGTEYEEKSGKMGYECCFVYQSGITHLWSKNRKEHHIIYSGKTLKNVVEVMPIQQLVQFHVDLGHRVSRIDTAIDVFDSGTPVQDFAEDWKHNRVVTRAKSGLLISDPKGLSGDTFYLGSLKKRRKLLRVYDKAAEQNVDKDWIRLEMQYGQGAARSSAKQIADCESLSETIIGQLRGFARFQVQVYTDIVENALTVNVAHNLPSGVSKRKHWLNTSVTPALVAQELETPGFIRDYLHYVETCVELKRKEIKTV